MPAHYALLLIGASLIGIGSAIFHPESSRIARFASGGRFGLAQSLFQVGGNFGQAMGPLLAAFIVVPFGQTSIAWFAVGSLIGIIVLWRVGGWYSRTARRAGKPQGGKLRLALPAPQGHVGAGRADAAGADQERLHRQRSSSYYTFYSIQKFGVSVQMSRRSCCSCSSAPRRSASCSAARSATAIGQKAMIWFSILGVLPFTLALPYANFQWTMVLTVLIGLILSSAFSNIVVFAQELVPGRVGMIAGIFFGFAFGMGGIAAAVLGVVADMKGIDFVFQICSYLPLLGLLTVFLPNMKEARKAQAIAS